MNILSMNTESKRYFLMWIFLVVVGWFLWFLFLDKIISVGSLLLPLVFGLTVGTLSGLSPVRAFQVCFLGFAVVAALFSFPTLLFEQGVFARAALEYLGYISAVLLFIGALSGLISLTSSILRVIVLRKGTQKLYMKPRQWRLLIWGATVPIDFLVLLMRFDELFLDHSYISFFESLFFAITGFFALGVYSGTFHQLESKELIASVTKLQCGAHGLFMVIVIFMFLTMGMSRKVLLLFPLLGLFSAITILGAHIGYRFRDSNFVGSPGSRMQNQEGKT
jgi:hypothetical protein